MAEKRLKQKNPWPGLNSKIANHSVFYLPEAKSNIEWIDEDTAFVGTNFENEDHPLTDSGYPRMVKILQRGTPLNQANPLYSAARTSVSTDGFAMEDFASYQTGKLHYFIYDAPGFFPYTLL